MTDLIKDPITAAARHVLLRCKLQKEACSENPDYDEDFLTTFDLCSMWSELFRANVSDAISDCNEESSFTNDISLSFESARDAALIHCHAHELRPWKDLDSIPEVDSDGPLSPLIHFVESILYCDCLRRVRFFSSNRGEDIPNCLTSKFYVTLKTMHSSNLSFFDRLFRLVGDRGRPSFSESDLPLSSDSALPCPPLSEDDFRTNSLNVIEAVFGSALR